MAGEPCKFRLENADGLVLNCTLDSNSHLTVTGETELQDIFPAVSNLRAFMDEIIRIKQLLNLNGLVKLEAEEE